MLCPEDTAPGGTVRDTPESGNDILIPWEVTVAHVVNMGSGDCCLWGEEGRGVDETGKPPLSKVPPLPGLKWPPKFKSCFI